MNTVIIEVVPDKVADLAGHTDISRVGVGDIRDVGQRGAARRAGRAGRGAGVQRIRVDHGCGRDKGRGCAGRQRTRDGADRAGNLVVSDNNVDKVGVAGVGDAVAVLDRGTCLLYTSPSPRDS